MSNLNGSSFNRGNTVTCYKCKGPGHFAKDCPQASNVNNNRYSSYSNSSPQPQQSWSSGRNMDNVTCFKCKQTGHYASSCPNGAAGRGTSKGALSGSSRAKRGRGASRGRTSKKARHTNSKPRTNKQSGVSCIVCGQTGHFFSACPSKGQTVRSSSSASASSATIWASSANKTQNLGRRGGGVNIPKCYKCGQTTHFVGACPLG